MGDRNIKNTNVKKKKKSELNSSAPSKIREALPQPELIKKKKKPQ